MYSLQLNGDSYFAQASQLSKRYLRQTSMLLCSASSCSFDAIMIKTDTVKETTHTSVPRSTELQIVLSARLAPGSVVLGPLRKKFRFADLSERRDIFGWSLFENAVSDRK